METTVGFEQVDDAAIGDFGDRELAEISECCREIQGTAEPFPCEREKGEPLFGRAEDA